MANINNSQSKKIVLNDNQFFKTWRDKLVTTDKVNNENWHSPFKDKTATYVLNVNTQLNPKYRKMSSLQTEPGFFAKLGFLGPVEININDVDHFIISYDQNTGVIPHNLYSSSDDMTTPDLTINNLFGSVSFKNWGTHYNPQDENCAFKNITINSGTSVQFTMHNQPSVEKIIINNDLHKEVVNADKSVNHYNPSYTYFNHYYSSQINISNMRNLKLLDLSKIKLTATGNLSLSNINPNCIIKLNPDLKIKYSMSDITRTNSLMNICPITTRKDFPYEEISIKQLLNKQNTTSEVIETTYSEFQEKLTNFALNSILQEVQAETKTFQSHFKTMKEHYSNKKKENKKMAR